MGRMLKRFFRVYRSLENLSSAGRNCIHAQLLAVCTLPAFEIHVIMSLPMHASPTNLVRSELGVLTWWGCQRGPTSTVWARVAMHELGPQSKLLVQDTRMEVLPAASFDARTFNV